MATEYHNRFDHFRGRRKHLHAAMAAIAEYEKNLSALLIEGLQKIENLTIHGITNKKEVNERVPTVSFTIKGINPSDISKKLASNNIFVWDGDYYAVEVIKHLGLEEKGGMVRAGAVHYNTISEIDKLIEILNSFD